MASKGVLSSHAISMSLDKSSSVKVNLFTWIYLIKYLTKAAIPKI
jgi:hypothetical protein